MTLRADVRLSKEERNARLDALAAAVKEWGEKEKKRLTDEVSFLKSVIKSRSGVGSLAKQNTEATDAYLVDRLNRFLEG